ncbi:MAG: site-specific integrase [Proteobacteria bacterium]|nr:MAG: site-specific integrase [Pseudomonadota bacterium]
MAPFSQELEPPQNPGRFNWWASYVEASGKRTRRSTGTEERKEAEALLAKWKVEIHQQRHWDAEPVRTYDELMLAYLKAAKGLKRSHDRDLHSARKLYETFTGKSLHEISPSNVRDYVSKRKSAGVSNATVNKEIGLLSAAMNWARKELDWDIPNPAQGRRLREATGRVRWLTRAETTNLLHAAQTVPQAPHLADFIRLGLFTGMRSGEMLGLEWKRVDLRENLVYLDGEHQKSGRVGSVPLNREARAALLARASFRSEHCPDSPWVFCDKEGERIKSIKRSFATACRRAKIVDFRPHDLRHTCAAWLVQAGMPMSEIRDLLRHSSVQVTERYAHLAPHNVRRAVDSLVNESRFSHVEMDGQSDLGDEATINS